MFLKYTFSVSDLASKFRKNLPYKYLIYCNFVIYSKCFHIKQFYHNFHRWGINIDKVICFKVLALGFIIVAKNCFCNKGLLFLNSLKKVKLPLGLFPVYISSLID